MAKINILDDHLISQIAAGEVVERPASVVKELVENSLDAGATEVRVELESGGKSRIVVIDDGSGMEADDSLLAFDRHATSKIASFEELERVATLGFRGEALASIAAVAKVELLTAASPGDGHRVRIEGGRVKVAEPAPRPQGTTLEVASLFFNVPARRKFLKKPQTEMRRAVEVVQGYALARPDVRFTVVHEGRTLLDALPTGDDLEAARGRIGQVFGRELADNLVEIPGVLDGTAASVGGLVGNPKTTRGRRLFVYVNRRLIRDRAILATFYRAVRDEWQKDDFPALFLFLDLPAEEVDVNVHPQKSEVRFRDPQVLRRVYDALRAGLADARGEVEAPLRQPDAVPERPFAWQGLGERARQTTGAWSGFGGGKSGAPGTEAQGDEWVVRETPATGYGGEGAPGSDGPAPTEDGGPPPPGALPGPGQRLATATYHPPQRAPVPLSGRSGEARSFRLLGQYKGTLLLLEGADGLYLIDQHVAHERILYERLRRTLRREKTASQRLLTPTVLELSPAECQRLLELADRLESCGFGVAELSGDTIGITAVPAVLSPEEGEALLLDLAQEKGDPSDDPEALRDALLDSLAASLSCKAAVKMHHPLRPQEMEALVAELFAAEQPYACPHGRPIVLTMSDADLERRFGRR